MNDRYGRLDLTRNGKKGISLKISDNLYELPVSNIKFYNCILPWGGGAYFRLIPFTPFKMGVRYLLKKEGAYLFYLHPWEIDARQPVVREASRFLRFRHYTNLDRTLSKLSLLVQDCEQCHFTTCFQYLKDIEGKKHELEGESEDQWPLFHLHPQVT
jgi:hypothetical protein